jgi:hypothetical protein
MDNERAICTHSKAKKVFIFSTYRKNKHDFLNEADYKQMQQFFGMQNIPYVPVLGKYKGNLERAFLVSAEHLPEEAVLYYARHYHQDEYMVLDNHKHGTYIATMVNCATREAKQIGFMRSMPKEDVMAMNLDYTYRPDMDTYFVVWNTDTTQQSKLEEEKENFFRSMMRKARMPSGEEPFGTPAYN